MYNNISNIINVSSEIGPAAARELVCLAVADRVRFPQQYMSPVTKQNFEVSYIVGRNESLLDSFSSFFQYIPKNNESYKQIFIEINKNLESVSGDEILHIPGMFYERAGIRDKKKQGSYYTPPHIARFMVRRSMDVLGQNDQGYSLTKTMDPACGGGSFLIEIVKYFTKKGFKGNSVARAIFGIDIDPGAVEVSIFVLTLCIIESCRNISIDEIKDILTEQIRCSNALYDCKTGFDLVIGNPPYISNKIISGSDKNYYKQNFRSADGQFDISVPFVEKGINMLRPGGLLCYITSNKFMAADYGQKLREIILCESTIVDLIDVSTHKSFKNTAVYPVIITLLNRRPEKEHNANLYRSACWDEIATSQPVKIEQSFYLKGNQSIITTELSRETLLLINKIRSSSRFHVPQNSIKCGLAMSGFNKWIIKDKFFQYYSSSNKKYHSFISAGQIEPFGVKEYDLIDTGCFNSGKWIETVRENKLVIPGISKRLVSAIDRSGSLLGRVYFIPESKIEYDLGFLSTLFNSSIINFYYRVMYWPVHLEGGYLRFNSGYLAAMPLPQISDIGTEKRELINKLIQIAAELNNGYPEGLDLNNLIREADTGVFRLYDFSSTEAEIVMDYLSNNGG